METHPITDAFLLNPHLTSAPPEAAATRAEEIARFHRNLPGYAPTPLRSLTPLAKRFGVGAVLVKDESSRLGLPSFKMLGASWATHRALACRASASSSSRLVTATDGNHGRAVARMARLLDLASIIVVPAGVPEEAIELIRTEGADVRVLDATYDEAVRHAADLAEEHSDLVLVQDTSWPGYEDVPRWIVDGYATLFDEARSQGSIEPERPIDLIVVPAGVGSLAQAAVRFARTQSGCRVVTVEPEVAACVRASLSAGAATTIRTGTTAMAGLNCGTPSFLAWPELMTGLAGALVVSEAQTQRAMEEFAQLQVDAGPCGAASLAGLAILARPGVREQLGLTADSAVLLLNTEAGSPRS